MKKKKSRIKRISGRANKTDSASNYIHSHLSIVGTSHISKDSVTSIRLRVSAFIPDMIAVELDRKRFNSLMEYYSKSDEKRKKDERIRISDIKKVGLKGFLFTLIGGFVQRKLGEKIGTEPGIDMKAAIDEANRLGIPIILIDRDIEETLREFSKHLSLRERMRFVYDLIAGAVFRRQIVEFDISSIPDEKLVSEMVSKVRERYPNVYKVLVEDRNRIMAENLAKLMKNNPGRRMLAVMGAGHEQEILNLVLKSKEEIFSEYKKSMDSKKQGESSYTYSFSI